RHRAPFSHATVFLEAPLDQHVRRCAGQLRQVAAERLRERGGRGIPVGVGAAHGLGDHVVDDAQRLKVRGGQLQRGRRLVLGLVRLPEDRGAPLRRDHAVDRILEHEDAVGHAQGEGAAATTLPDHDGDGRDPQASHLPQTARDRLGLTALLGADPGVGARRVDQRNDRVAELLGELHQAERLPVPLRVRHPEVALQVLLHVAPLLVPDHHDRPSIQARPAAHDRRGVAERAVAVQLDEIREDPGNVIERVRAAGVPRELGPLDRGQVPIRLGLELLEFPFQDRDLVGHVQSTLPRELLQASDLLFELPDPLLEIQLWGGHPPPIPHVLTSRTWSTPKRARSSSTSASLGVTVMLRERKRRSPESWRPLPPFARAPTPFGAPPFPAAPSPPFAAPDGVQRTYMGEAPGLALKARVAASIVATSPPGGNQSSSAIASDLRTSARGMTSSRKIGGSSSSRSRPDTFPKIRTGASWTRRWRQRSHASPNASTVAVPWKSSTVMRPHSFPLRREICRLTPVMTQASSIFWSRCSFRLAVLTCSKMRTSSRNLSSGWPLMKKPRISFSFASRSDSGQGSTSGSFGSGRSSCVAAPAPPSRASKSEA